MNRLLVGIIGIMAGAHLHAQTVEGVSSQQLAEEWYPVQDGDGNYEGLYENVLQQLSHQVDLNRATPELLRSLNVLSSGQLRELLAYREATGPLLSPYELQVIPGFDRNTIDKLLPLVIIRDPADRMHALLNKIRYNNQNYMLVRMDRQLERRPGFTSSIPDQRYQGDPNRYYMRVRSARSQDYSVGITAEKDAGEALTWNTRQRQYGADFYSAHVQLLNKGKIRNLIIGDYLPQFGQGLTLGSSFGFGKGAETILTTRRANLGFVPYTSVNEFNYFRGLAATVDVAPGWSCSAFVSATRRDGQLVSEEGNNEATVTSLGATGLHRNRTELAGRGALREYNTGASIQYERGQFAAGLLAHEGRFSAPLQRKPTLYNQFYFQGDHYLNTAAFVNYSWYNISIFSEVSHTHGGGTGWVAGVQAHLTSQLDMSILARHYAKNYSSLYANAFSESTNPQNEQGLYWGFRYAFHRRLQLTGYMDMFRFPGMRFRNYAPSAGYETLLRITYQPSRVLTCYGQFRQEVKDRNTADNTRLYQTAAGTRQNYQVHAGGQVSRQWSFAMRVQGSHYTLADQSGWGLVLFQDVRWKTGNFSFTFRHAMFSTDDYDNRQYVYEQDVWLGYSMPAYFGTGVRNYLLLQYDASDSITLWVRYGRTHYSTSQETGSGMDKLTGNNRNDLKLQVRIRF